MNGKSVKSYNQSKSVVQTIFNYEITQGYDGYLEVESNEGIGTRFIIEIPITT